MATYYVNFTGGDDTKDGQSQANAWKTITKVNAAAIVAGDYVLFMRGETWTGVQLTITWSGTSGNLITFGAYGTGARPIIDGNDTVNCIIGNNVDYLAFENIECTQGLDYGFAFSNCDYVTVTNCDAHDCGNDNLIFITGCHDCAVTGGKFHDSYERVLTTTGSGIEIADDCYNITVTGAECYGATGPLGMGITIHSHAATGMPYNITISGCSFHNNSKFGVNVTKQNNAPETPRSIVFQNCVSYDNTSEGFRVYTNVANNYINGVTLNGCHAYGNTSRAFYLNCDNLVVRRCVFEGRGDLVSCHTVQWVNNTAYFIGNAPLYPLYINGARTGGTFWVKNNILYRSGVGGMIIGVDTSVNPSSLDIDYNLYHQATDGRNDPRWYWRGVYHNWNGWKAFSGRDAHSPTPGDPCFVNATTDDFDLEDNSPAIDAGVDVGLAYIGTAPDCGAYEWEDTSGISTKTGNHHCEYYTAGGILSSDYCHC